MRTPLWQLRAGVVGIFHNGVLWVINCKLRSTKTLKLSFKGEVNYHATAHRAIKWESIHTKTRMKGQGSCELVEKTKERRLTIDDYLQAWFMHTLHFFMNDLGLDRKVFCRRS